MEYEIGGAGGMGRGNANVLVARYAAAMRADCFDRCMSDLFVYKEWIVTALNVVVASRL